MTLSEIGEMIRRARREAKMSQSKLAEKADVSRSTIYLLETGNFDELGIRKVDRVCMAVGLELAAAPIKKRWDEVADKADLVRAAEEADRRVDQAFARIRERWRGDNN